MHVAVCSLFSQSGYYELEGREDGWPHFRQLKSLPDLSTEQENFMKDHILLYFETHDLTLNFYLLNDFNEKSNFSHWFLLFCLHKKIHRKKERQEERCIAANKLW